jgi:hypothetical protein
MAFDTSRSTFDPFKNYSGVVMEQGRVQTDADWNEQLAEDSRRVRAGTLDALGHVFFPPTTPYAFLIAASTSGTTNSVDIGLGRMYLDGLLVENHGPHKTAVWDPALDELSNTPQPPPATLAPLDSTNSIPFTSQPYQPGATLPSGDGPYLAYLDAWQRPVTFIEDPELIDPAIGIDTTGRLQTAWQVELMPMTESSIPGTVATPTPGSGFEPGETVTQTGSNATAVVVGTVPASGPMVVTSITGTPVATGAWTGQSSGAVFNPTAVPATVTWSCETPDSAIPWPATSGWLSNDLISSGPSGPCCLTTGTGYTGQENQFYRVEIHNPGGAQGAGATFKWSRENASVQTTVTAIGTGNNTEHNPTTVLTVQSLGRDQVLGFQAGDWIEITGQTLDDNSQPGELAKIDFVTPSNMTITLTAPLTSTPPSTDRYIRIIRWDQKGKIYDSNNNLYIDLDAIGSGGVPNGVSGIPVPPAGTKIQLENGIVVSFGLTQANGNFLPMNYWNFAARTADGKIDVLDEAPPRGIYHHFTKLAIVTFGASAGASNCRATTSSATDCGCCCTYTVGKGGTYGTIQQAVDAVTKTGGEICLLAGNFYENVTISKKRNLVIHGCGAQTHVYSASLNPSNPAPPGGSGASSSTLTAVFTLEDCENIEFREFSVTADREDIGILMDRQPDPNSPVYEYLTSNEDILLEGLTVTASAMPAIVARNVQKLHIDRSIVTMRNVETIFPAVYLSGSELYFDRNTVTVSTSEDLIISRADGSELLDVDSAYPVGSLQVFKYRACGGIQIGGPSKNIFVTENTLTGGARNGITLGNFIELSSQGLDNGTLTGLMVELESVCSSGGTGLLPNPSGPGSSDTPKIGAGGLIENLLIARNVITSFGMSGIGPVGFFDLHASLEIISLVNVSIIANVVAHTFERRMQAFDSSQSKFGYGAISLPDVQNLAIRDNTITDFGYSPGAEVCGTFVLHGEGVEISRNVIRETRDLTTAPTELQGSYGGMRGGIYLYLVTPITLDTSSSSAWIKASKPGTDQVSTPRYTPGFPALRVAENQVRMALGMALYAAGLGPFSIVDNHFSTGGTAVVQSDAVAGLNYNAPDPTSLGTFAGAMTVGILNLGLAIELAGLLILFEDILAARSGSDYKVSPGNLADASNGTVLFTNNICQLESRVNSVRGIASVVIASLDHVLFSNNQLWVDGPPITALMDVLLFGVSLQATNNRLQEAILYCVVFSGVTLGILNFTTQNIATYCLEVAANSKWKQDTPNFVLFNTLCPNQ